MNATFLELNSGSATLIVRKSMEHGASLEEIWVANPGLKTERMIEWLSASEIHALFANELKDIAPDDEAAQRLAKLCNSQSSKELTLLLRRLRAKLRQHTQSGVYDKNLDKHLARLDRAIADYR